MLSPRIFRHAIVWAYTAVAVFGCTGMGAPPPASQDPAIDDAQSSAPLDLGLALLVMGYSGPYSDQAERTLIVPGELVVWDDGLVVVNVSPNGESPAYRAFQLRSSEFEGVRSTLRTAQLRTVSLPNPTTGGTCADCNVTIIQTDVDGAFVEIAVYGLAVTVRPSYTKTLPVPEGVIQAAELIEALRARAVHDGAPWSGAMPALRAAPLQAGG